MITDEELKHMLTHERMRKADTIRLTQELRKMYDLNKKLIYEIHDENRFKVEMERLQVNERVMMKTIRGLNAKMKGIDVARRNDTRTVGRNS